MIEIEEKSFSEYKKLLSEEDKNLIDELVKFAFENAPADHTFSMSWSPKAFFPAVIKKTKENKWQSYLAINIREKNLSIHFCIPGLAKITSEQIKGSKAGVGCLNVRKEQAIKNLEILKKAILLNWKTN